MERVGILTLPLFAVCLIGGTSLGVALGWGSVNAVNGMSTNVGGEISQRLRDMRITRWNIEWSIKGVIPVQLAASWARTS